MADPLADLIASVRRPPADGPSRTLWDRAAADPLADLREAIAVTRRATEATTVRYRRSTFAPAGKVLVIDPPITTRRVLIIPTGPAGDRAIAALEAAGMTLEPADGTESRVPICAPMPAPTERPGDPT